MYINVRVKLSFGSDKLFILETQSTVMGKLQILIESLLQNHGLSPTAESYYLKLKLPSHDDLLIGRVGEQILVGLQNDDLGNPVLSYDYNQGEWFPVSFENKLGTTALSFFKNGKRMIIPYRMKKFLVFQGMLIRNIKGLLENEVKV